MHRRPHEAVGQHLHFGTQMPSGSVHPINATAALVVGDQGYDSDKAREHRRAWAAQVQPRRAALVRHETLLHLAFG